MTGVLPYVVLRDMSFIIDKGAGKFLIYGFLTINERKTDQTHMTSVLSVENLC